MYQYKLTFTLSNNQLPREMDRMIPGYRIIPVLHLLETIEKRQKLRLVEIREQQGDTYYTCEMDGFQEALKENTAFLIDKMNLPVSARPRKVAGVSISFDD